MTLGGKVLNRQKLRQWCKENSVEMLAVRCECTAGYILKIIGGSRSPSRKLAKKIDTTTRGKVPWRQWIKEETQNAN